MTVQFTSSTLIHFASLPIGEELPTQHTLTVGSAASAGATELTVTALTGYLQEGRKLTVGGVEITVTADAKRGATTVPIKALGTGESIATSSTANYYELFEFIGGSRFDVSSQENVISIRNFKSGQWSESAKVMTGVSMACEGQLHVDDLSVLSVIRPASFVLGAEVWADVLKANGDRWQGCFLVSNYSEPTALDNVVNVSFTLNSQRAILIPTPPVLTAA